MIRDDFAVFILSYGRPNKQLTLNSLLSHGYTGKWYILVSDEDSTLNEYIEKYGDNVVVFTKSNEKNDLCDNFEGVRSILYARNECFNIAKNLGIKYFIEFDDDYSQFKSRRLTSDNKLTDLILNDFDGAFSAMITYMEECPQITSLAMSQNGDWIGGKDGSMFKEKLKRKAMNTFMCCVDRPFKFVGRLNEDVNTYITQGSTGKLFLTFCDLTVHQGSTQQNSGGLTDTYKELGTYVKSFYSVMNSPSSVKIGEIVEGHNRIHHSISWNNAVPKIISSKFKK